VQAASLGVSAGRVSAVVMGKSEIVVTDWLQRCALASEFSPTSSQAAANMKANQRRRHCGPNDR